MLVVSLVVLFACNVAFGPRTAFSPPLRHFFNVLMTDVTDVSSIPLVHAPFYHLNLNIQLPVCEVKCQVVALHGL